MNSPVFEELEKHWNPILGQYRSKAEDSPKKHGAGISIFEFLEKPRAGLFNCTYGYLEKDSVIWEKYINEIPDGHKILEKYDPDVMYLIALHIPDKKSGKHLKSIRAFKFDDHQEIRLMGDKNE